MPHKSPLTCWNEKEEVEAPLVSGLTLVLAASGSGLGPRFEGLPGLVSGGVGFVELPVLMAVLAVRGLDFVELA